MVETVAREIVAGVGRWLRSRRKASENVDRPAKRRVNETLVDSFGAVLCNLDRLESFEREQLRLLAEVMVRVGLFDDSWICIDRFRRCPGSIFLPAMGLVVEADSKRGWFKRETIILF